MNNVFTNPNFTPYGTAPMGSAYAPQHPPIPKNTQPLTKDAWVYLPYGYSEETQYNVFYLSHGGWSNETTIMGTDENPSSFKYVIDHAIEDGKINPLILVMPTYNKKPARVRVFDGVYIRGSGRG